MRNRSEWKATAALACFLALFAGVLISVLLEELVLSSMRIDHSDLAFPIALISSPTNETIILGVTLWFTRHKGAGLSGLGLRKPGPKILAIASVLALPLYLLGSGISICIETGLGPDPRAEFAKMYLLPRDPFQLTAMVILSLVLVGPCEELAFRGFIQRGLENSFGKLKGLLIASVLFAIPHGLLSPRAIVPTFVGGLALGHVWQRTNGNTTASALMHGINNSVSMLLAYLAMA